MSMRTGRRVTAYSPANTRALHSPEREVATNDHNGDCKFVRSTNRK